MPQEKLIFEKVPGKYVLGYWAIRGLAAPIRMALTAAGVDFVDQLYALGNPEDPSTYSRENWYKVAAHLEQTGEHPFPNLPYLVLPTGEIFVETRAIMNHVGRVFNLGGSTEVEKLRDEEINEFMKDFRSDASPMFYSNLAGLKGSFLAETAPYYMEGLEKRLAQFKTNFFGGDAATLADFNVADFIGTNIMFAADNGGAATAELFFEKYPLLRAHYARVLSMPALAKYFGSSAASLSANNWSAQWPGWKK